MSCLWPAHLVTVLHRTWKYSSQSQFMLCSHPILAGMLPSALQEDDTMLVYWLHLQLNSGWIKKSILSPREINLLSCLHACRLCHGPYFFAHKLSTVDSNNRTQTHSTYKLHSTFTSTSSPKSCNNPWQHSKLPIASMWRAHEPNQHIASSESIHTHPACVAGHQNSHKSIVALE